MNIEDYIPYGEKNAVSREYLCSITGFGDRMVRKMIEKARQDIPILNLQGGNGYFLPLPEEKHLIEKWIRQEAARARTIHKNMNGARKAVS